MHKTFYYARVSTREQNLDRQLEAFRALGADDREIITDKESGKNLDRPGYQTLKSAMLRSGDTLVVKSLDRLSRSKADIHSELQWFKENNIHLKVIDLPTTMMDLPPGQEWVFEMVNNILIEVLGTIAEQERLTIHQRQREGIDAALVEGDAFHRYDRAAMKVAMAEAAKAGNHGVVDDADAVHRRAHVGSENAADADSETNAPSTVAG